MNVLESIRNSAAGLKVDQEMDWYFLRFSGRIKS